MHFQAILHNISCISPITPKSFAASQSLQNNHADKVHGYTQGNELQLISVLLVS